MPRVPTYDGQQIRSAPTQGGMQAGISSPDAFGAAQARQVSAAGQGMTVVADAMERQAFRDDTAKADAVYVTLQNEYNATSLGWKKDRVGAKAEGLVDDADKWWAEAETRYGANLNDRQRQLLGQNASRLRTSALADIGGFQENQKRDFSVKAATAVIQSQVEMAAADPRQAAASRLAIQKKVAELKTTLGWGDDEALRESKKFTTQMHVEAVQTLIAKGDPTEAKRYFESARKLGDFDETKANDISASIAQAAADQTGQSFANKIAGLPYAEQLAKAEAINDPAEKKAALEHIDANYLRTTKAKKVQVDDVAGRAELEYQKTGRTPVQLLSQLEQLDPGKAADIIKVIKADQKAKLTAAKGESVKTDWNVYATLRSMSPEELKKEDLRKYVDKIAPAQMEQLFDLHDKVTKPEKVAEAATQEQQLSAFTRELDLKGEELGQFQSAFGAEVNAYIKRNGGKAPDYEARQAILYQLNSQVVTGSFLGLIDRKKPAYKVPLEQRTPVPEGTFGEPAPAAKPAPIHNIPDADRKMLSTKMRERGIAVTEENLQKFYKNYKGL